MFVILGYFVCNIVYTSIFENFQFHKQILGLVIVYYLLPSNSVFHGSKFLDTVSVNHK